MIKAKDPTVWSQEECKGCCSEQVNRRYAQCKTYESLKFSEKFDELCPDHEKSSEEKHAFKPVKIVKSVDEGGSKGSRKGTGKAPLVKDSRYPHESSENLEGEVAERN